MNQHPQADNQTSTPQPRYITQARNAFVGELAPLSPHEIVAAGLKTTSEWCEHLRAARELYPHQTGDGARAINAHNAQVRARNSRNT